MEKKNVGKEAGNDRQKRDIWRCKTERKKEGLCREQEKEVGKQRRKKEGKGGDIRGKEQEKE